MRLEDFMVELRKDVDQFEERMKSDPTLRDWEDNLESVDWYEQFVMVIESDD